MVTISNGSREVLGGLSPSSFGRPLTLYRSRPRWIEWRVNSGIVAFLDADELWLPEKLECCLDWMWAHDSSFVYHDHRHMSADGFRLGAIITGAEELNLGTRRGHGGSLSMVFDRERVGDLRFPAGSRGANRDADKSHAFVIRADGSVLSRESAKTFWGNEFDQSRVHPGDTIVVPEKTYRGNGIRTLLDFSQLFSSIALGAGALAVITN